MKPVYQNFEQTVHLLLAEAKKGPVSVHTLLTILSGQGRILLLIFLSLGFGQIPGIALILGLCISYLGIRIGLGKNFIWMPNFLHHRKIPSYFLTKVIEQILQMLKFIKRWSRPRYQAAIQTRKARMINGSMIALVGLCLATSPPLPLTGMIGYAAICLIAIGLLNDDGAYVILGSSAALVYLVVVLTLLHYFSFTQIFEWLTSFVLLPQALRNIG